MRPVMQAIRAKALANATLVGPTMLDGQRIYQEMPDVATANLNAWVILRCVSEPRDVETGLADEIYEFAVAARSADLADGIAEEILSTFAWRHGVAGSGTLTGITGRRLAEVIIAVPSPPPDSDADETKKTYYRFPRLRVATYAA